MDISIPIWGIFIIFTVWGLLKCRSEYLKYTKIIKSSENFYTFLLTSSIILGFLIIKLNQLNSTPEGKQFLDNIIKFGYNWIETRIKKYSR